MTESRSTFDTLKSINTDSTPYSTSVSLTEMFMVGAILSIVKFVLLLEHKLPSSQPLTYIIQSPSGTVVELND